VRIIDKTGPLANPADRDHCIQYMVAIPLIHGRLVASDYENAVANDPRVDALRAKMQVRENPDYTRDYFDTSKRYIGNAVQVFFRDGTHTDRVAIDFPIGHRQRRAEGIPVLKQKFEAAIAEVLPRRRVETLKALAADVSRFEAMPVHELMDLLAV
jgi:2-methylcitrate dehydratase